MIGCGAAPGTTQEIPCTAFARTLLDDADAVTARATLGITAATNSGSVCDGRLTLTSGVPNTAGTNVVGASTIFFTPYIGNLVSLWSTSESQWVIYPFTELSLSLAGTTANTNYDLFLFDNAGTLTLEWVAWSNNGAGTSARATSIIRLNGTWVKSTDNRRYLGSFRTTSAGMTEDSEGNNTPRCLLQNATNRVLRTLSRSETVASWTYTGTSIRSLNNNTSNRVEVVNGIDSTVNCIYVQNINASMDYRVGIGLNSTTAFSSQLNPFLSVSSGYATGVSVLNRTLSIGYNYFQMLEQYIGGSTSSVMGGSVNNGMVVSYWA